MTNTVDYVLNLRDKISPGLENANTKAKGLESTMGGIKNVIGKIGIAMGGMMLAMKGFEYLKEATAESGNLKIAQDQVRAGLKSTANAAGITYKEISKINTSLFHASNFTKEQLMSMQSIIVTFPGITKKSFGSAGQIIADMSTRMGQDVKMTAIQVGKALQDPVLGATALRRVGVNLTAEQSAAIKKLVAEGKKQVAQQMIMTELNKEFGGSAKAAYDALPLSEYGKTMADVKEKIGDAVLALETALEPAITTIGKTIMIVIDSLEALFHWMSENKTIIEAVTIGVVAGVVAWKAYNLVTLIASGSMLKFIFGLTGMFSGIIANTAAVWAWTTALLANPAVWVAIGIGALIASVVALTKHFGGFKNMIKGVWEILKAFALGVGNAFKGLAEIIVGALTFNPAKMVAGLKTTVEAVKDAGKNISSAWNNSDAKAAAEKGKSLIPQTGKQGLMGKSGTPGQVTKAPATKATGQKNINIHVAYNAPLIKDFTISTTNIQEGFSKLKEKVTDILTSATHDSLMVAEY